MSTEFKILNRLDDVTLLRCVAVISLVVWHTYCPITCWGCWSTEFSGRYWWLLTRIIPDANMPLFTFIAGYLFSYQITNDKYTDFNGFFKNKVHRLLIPFVILGAGINLLEYGKDISDMLYGGPNHLWYCLMLFYCYILCWFVEKKCGKWLNYFIMAGSFCVALYYGSVWSLWHTKIPGGWEFLLFYYGYFYLGFVLFNYRERLFGNWMFISLYIVLYLVSCACQFQFPYLTIVPIRSISYMLLLFALANVLTKNRGEQFVKNKLIAKLNYYSFGIYVFHQWIIWNVSHIPTSKEIIRPIMETHYIIAPICFFVIVLLLSIGLTHYSLKTKIGRFLFL